MRIFVFNIVFLVGIACSQARPAPPRIVCDDPIYDFGELANTGTVTHAFVIRNDGDSPLQFGKVKACCGASARLDATVVAPGSNTTLDVALALKGRNGRQNKVFYVASNDPSNPHLRLVLEGTAVADVSVSPSFLNFENVSALSPFTNSVVVTFARRPETALTGIVSSCKEFVAVAEGQGASRRIEVRTAPPLLPGVTRGTVRLLTDDPKSPEISFVVSATVVSDLQVIPREILLHIPDGSPRPVTRYVALRSRSKTPFKILAVELPEGLAEATLTVVSTSDWRCELNGLLTSADFNGSNIVFRTDHPDSPEVSIPLRVRGRWNGP